MAKLVSALILAFSCCVFLNTVVSEEAADREEKTEQDVEGDRSGAFVKAAVSYQYAPAVRPGPVPLPPGRQLSLVQCFACVDCPKVLENTTTKWCPRTLDHAKHSSCVTYAEQFKQMQKSWYIRGCATERGSCSDIRQAHSSHSDMVKLVFCDECEGDRCNGASRSLTDFTLAVLTLLITPLAAKMTLS